MGLDRCRRALHAAPNVIEGDVAREAVLLICLHEPDDFTRVRRSSSNRIAWICLSCVA
jgi:hypothetical protein